MLSIARSKFIARGLPLSHLSKSLKITAGHRNFFWSSSKHEETVELKNESVENTTTETSQDQMTETIDIKSASIPEKPKVELTDSEDAQGTIFDTLIEQKPQIQTSIPESETDLGFRWFNDIDTANVINGVTPIYTDNIVQGGSTYGFWDLLAYLDDVFYNQWIYFAEDLGMGLGTGLLVTALGVRCVFLPLMAYSQITGIKVKLLQPDQEALTESYKRHAKSGNREQAKVERQKMKALRSKHGIYPMLSFLNVFQFPIHLTFISMINRLSYNYDIKPAILTDGFLWFKDLSSPDPYGILPIIGGGLTLFNIMSTSTTNINPTMRRIRRYMNLLPFITIPIWMTFPAAFNLYWMTSSILQVILLNLFRNLKFREFIGIPKFLPGTKLEQENKMKYRRR